MKKLENLLRDFIQMVDEEKAAEKKTLSLIKDTSSDCDETQAAVYDHAKKMEKAHKKYLEIYAERNPKSLDNLLMLGYLWNQGRFADYFINDMLIKSGKRYIVILIDKDNIASIKNRERAGYKKIGYINQFRFFGLKYDYIDKKLLSYLQK